MSRPVSSVITNDPGRINPTIALLRRTNALTDDLIASFMGSMQTQLDRDYLAQYRDSATLIQVPANEPVPPDAWQCVFFDHSDQANALGYHDVTPAGLPVMKIFVLDDLAAGVFWTVTASHEILETKGDPFLNRTVVVTNDDGSVDEFPYELCDACEDDRFSYAVRDGAGRTHHLSDFVYPAYWDPTQPPGSTRFSFRNVCPGPLSLAVGGYTGFRRIAPASQATEWGQRFAAGGPPGPRAIKTRASSRTVRRGVATIPA